MMIVFGVGSIVPTLLMLSKNIKNIYVPSNYGIPGILEGEKCLFNKKLNIEYYDHNYYHIENKTKEDDSNWNLRDMHHVRDTISKISKKPEEVLSEYVLNKYSKLEYWKDSNKRNY